MTDSSKDALVLPSATLPSESSDDPQNYEVDKVSCSSQDNLVPPSATSPSESSDNPHNHQDDIRRAFTAFYRELTYLTEGSEEEYGKDDTSEYPKPVPSMIDACHEMMKKLKSIKDSRSETEGAIKWHQNLVLGRNQGIDRPYFANMRLLDSVTRWNSDLVASLELLIEERDSVISELKLLGQYLEEVSPGIFATTEENTELRLVFRAVFEHLTESKSKESKLQQLEKENKKIGGDNLLLTENNEFFLSKLRRLEKCLQEVSPDFATSEENVEEKVFSAACKPLNESKHRELQKLISSEGGELSVVHEDRTRIEEENKKMSEDHASHLNESRIMKSSLLQKLSIAEAELIAARQDLAKSKIKEAKLLEEFRVLEGKNSPSLLSSLKDIILCQFKVLGEIKNIIEGIKVTAEGSQDHVSIASDVPIVLEIVENVVNEIDHHTVSIASASDASRHNDMMESSNDKNEAEGRTSQQQEEGTQRPGKNVQVNDDQPPSFRPQRAAQQTSQHQAQPQPQPQATYAGGSGYNYPYYPVANQGPSSGSLPMAPIQLVDNYPCYSYFCHVYNYVTGHFHPAICHLPRPLAHSAVAEDAEYQTYDSSAVGAMPHVQHQQQSHPPQGMAPLVGTIRGGQYFSAPYGNPAAGYGTMRPPGMPPYRGP